MSSPIVKKAKPKQSLAVKLLAVVFSLSAVGAVISYVIYQEWAWREHRRNPDPETPPNTPHVLPISEPVVSENPLASTPEGLSDVIYLPREPFEEKISHDILGQELDRQALWITAREEFGLRPKDGGIGDAKPEGLPADRIFHVSLKLTEARMVSLTSVFEQGEKGQRRRV